MILWANTNNIAFTNLIPCTLLISFGSSFRLIISFVFLIKENITNQSSKKKLGEHIFYSKKIKYCIKLKHCYFCKRRVLTCSRYLNVPIYNLLTLTTIYLQFKRNVLWYLINDVMIIHFFMQYPNNKACLMFNELILVRAHYLLLFCEDL